MFASLYPFVLFTHIAAAIALVGSSLTAPLIRRAIQNASTSDQLAEWLDFARRATRLNPIAALVLLASGIYLGAAGWWVTGWFAVAVFAWLVNSALAGGVVKRTMRALAQRAGGSSGEVDDDLDQLRRSLRLQIAEEVMLANDVAILYVMIAKPEVVGSLVILAFANLVVVGIGVVSRASSRSMKRAEI